MRNFSILDYKILYMKTKISLLIIDDIGTLFSYSMYIVLRATSMTQYTVFVVQYISKNGHGQKFIAVMI